MREKVFWFFVVVLLLDVAVIQSINPYVRINPVQAQEIIPNLSVDPPETVDPLLVVGQEFTVSLNISNAGGSSVDGLYAFEAKIAFNRDVVNCTSRNKIVPGPFWDDWFPDDYSVYKSIDYAAGYVLVAISKDIPYTGGGAIGDGILAYITFTVIANARATLLQYADLGEEGGTYLRTAVGGITLPIEPFTTQDGVFDNRPGPNTPPVADFSVLPLEATKRGEVSLDASASYDPDAWITRYEWNYGDGTSEIYLRERLKDINLTTTPIHTYNLNGTYPVTLTVADSDGATATTSSQVTVLFDIAVTNVESPFKAIMPGTLVTIDVTVANYGDFNEAFNLTAYYDDTAIETQEIWNLASQTEQIFTFNWDATGVDLGQYTLKANASIVEGEVNVGNNEYIDSFVTVAESNVINYPVFVGGVRFNVVVESTSSISAFNFNRAENRTSFNVTGESGTGGFCNVTIPMKLLNASSPDAWIVKFDDALISYTSTSNGTHYFIYFGYIHGDTPSTVDIIGETVATPPIALFTPSKTTAMAGESVTFDASTSYDPDGTIESWTWNFNGETDTGEVIQHSFATNGTYIVTLTVKDDENLANSTQVTITVIDYPIAGFSYSPSEPLVDQTITFDAAASNPVGGTITEYAWKFGDGQTGTGKTTTHSYLTTGTFTVNLTVTDSEGLTNSTTKTVTVQIHDIALSSLTATPSTVRKGGIVTIQLTADNNGNFTESFTITAYYHDTATDVVIETKSITSLAGGNSQLLTIVWNTTNLAPDTYTLKVETSAILEETRTEDNTITDVTVIVQKKISSLTIEASSTTVTLGSSTTITGTLTPTLQGKTITLQYRPVGQSWITLFILTTDAQGNYQFTWTPTLAGTYEIQATWQGDANTEACQSQIQTVIVEEAQGIPIEYVAVALVLALILIVVVVYLLRVRKR